MTELFRMAGYLTAEISDQYISTTGPYASAVDVQYWEEMLFETVTCSVLQ